MQKKERGESQGGKSAEKEQLPGVSVPQLCKLDPFQFFFFFFNCAEMPREEKTNFR